MSPRRMDGVLLGLQVAGRPGVLIVPDPLATEVVELGSGVRVPDRFGAWFEFGGGIRVELDVRAVTGRTWVAQLSILAFDESGVSRAAMAKISVAQLLERAVESMAILSSLSRAKPQPDRAAASASTRRRVSDERLVNVAAVIAAGGKVADVMKQENVGERQARRLMSQAKEQGQ